MVNKPMIEDTISATTARRTYDRLGLAYDWAERFEGRAKQLALPGWSSRWGSAC